MKNRVSISFWPQKRQGTTLQPDSTVKIYCRLTVNGERRVEHSTGLTTTYSNWVAGASMGHVKGRTQADKHINTQLTKLRDELIDIWADLERQSKPVTAKRILTIYKAGGSTATSLVDLFAKFLAEQKTLIGIDIKKATLGQHRARYGNLQDFLAAQKLTDLRPEEFTHSVADKMLYWLIGQQQFARNTALKNLQNISQVLRWGVRRELLDKNPMDLYKYKLAEAKPLVYLTEVEVQALAKLPLASKQLERVRDAFIFQCYTGLAYADLRALAVAQQAEVLPDGRRLLRGRRAKSQLHKGYEYVIPLLPEAEQILSLYNDKLPVCVNQLYNKCLKQIGLFAGLEPEKCTSHIGRKTAGVLLLNAGVRMEVVSKVLGHSSVKMTEKVYAKILDKTVLQEFDRVFAPMGAPTPEPATTGRVLQMWKGGAVA